MSTVFGSTRWSIPVVLMLAMAAVASAQWAPVSGTDGLHGTSLYVGDTVMVVATSGGIRRRDASGTWEQISGGLPPSIKMFRVDYVKAGNLLALGTDSGLFVSHDVGRTWKRINGLDAGTTGSVYAVVGRDSTITVGCERGALRVVPGTGQVLERLCADSLRGGAVRLLHKRDNDIYMVTAQPGGTASEIRSSSGCIRVEGGFDSTADVLSMHVSAGAGLIGSTKGVFRSTTGQPLSGTTRWALLGTGGLLDSVMGILDTVVLNSTLELMGLGGRGGFAYSIDGGRNWFPTNDGLPADPAISAIVIHGDTVYLCLRGGGVYRRLLQDILLHVLAITVSYVSGCPGESGDPVTLNVASVIPGALNGAVITWRDRESGVESTGLQVVVHPTSTALYDLVIKRFGRVVDSVAVRVKVVKRANAGTDRTICAGDTIVLGGPYDGESLYSWGRGDGVADPLNMDDPRSPKPRVWPGTTTTYVLTATSKDFPGCVTRDAVRITVLGGPRAYVLRTDGAALTAMSPGVGRNFRWLRDGLPLDSGVALDKYTPKDPGAYTVEVTEAGGRVLRSAPYLIDGNSTEDGLILPDIFFGGGVEGERTVYELMLRTDGNDTLVIDSARFEPYDSESCPEDANDFSLSSDIAGLVVAPGAPGSVFLQCIPRTTGIEVARLVVNYSKRANGLPQPQPPVKGAVLVLSVPPGDYQTTVLGVESVAGAAQGQRIDVKVRIDSVFDPKHLLSENPSFQMTLTAPARLLHPEDGINDSTGCFFLQPVRRYVPLGLSQLRIDIEGTYTRDCNAPLVFPFTAMLGSYPSGMIRVQRFRWLGTDGGIIVVRTGEIRTFTLQGLCGSGDSMRLIRPDGRRPKSPKIAVRPNPADDAIEIDYDVPVAGPAAIVIHDVFGRAVRTVPVGDARAGMNTYTCGVADLPAGTYFVTVAAGGGRHVVRLDITR